MDWNTVADTGLEIALTDNGESEVFERFFAGYDRAFVLPNEKEDAEGLRDCLALNFGEERLRLEREYGPFRELCLIARDADDRSFVGGANFIALEVAGDGGPQVSANLNYIYVDQDQRRKGYFSRLVAATRASIAAAFPGHGEPLVFIELNDPLRMSPEDYARDTEFTGLDQLDRIRIWAKLGTQIVDHAYVQPPLTPDAEPDATLIYGLLTARRSLAACTLRDHLRTFFGISVLKGAPLVGNAEAREQIDALDRLCTAGERIALLDPASLLAQVRGRGDIDRLLAEGRMSVREAIRAEEAG